jgi:hypothetical protein
LVEAGIRYLPQPEAMACTVLLRLPEGIITNLKVLANKRDVSYQSILKKFLADRIKEELEPRR